MKGKGERKRKEKGKGDEKEKRGHKMEGKGKKNKKRWQVERDLKERNCKRKLRSAKMAKMGINGRKQTATEVKEGAPQSTKRKQNNTERKGGEIIRMVKYKISK